MYGTYFQLPMEPRGRDLRDAAMALRRGLVVAMPSAEGYLLCVNADLEDSADLLASRDPEPPTLTLPDVESFDRAFPRPHPMLLRVRDNILQTFATIRVPHPAFPEGLNIKVASSDIAREVIAQANVPVFSIVPRNRTGGPFANGSLLNSSLKYRPDYVLGASIPFALTEMPRLMLLPTGIGVISLGRANRQELQDRLRMRVLFVCLGNLNRSVMAEALLKHWTLADAHSMEVMGHDFLHAWLPESAGVIAVDGASPPPEMIEAAEVFGCHELVSANRAAPFQPEIARFFDRVFPMTNELHQAINRQLPRGKSIFIPQLGDLPDPMGGSPEAYKRAAEKIAWWLEELFVLREASVRVQPVN